MKVYWFLFLILPIALKAQTDYVNNNIDQGNSYDPGLAIFLVIYLSLTWNVIYK